MYNATEEQLKTIDSLLRHTQIEAYDAIETDSVKNLVFAFTDTDGEHYRWVIAHDGTANITFGDAADEAAMVSRSTGGLNGAQLRNFSRLQGKEDFVKLIEFQLCENHIGLKYKTKWNGDALLLVN